MNAVDHAADAASSHASRFDLQRRCSGVLLHLTSLPGPHGIGDFGPAAFHVVDWLAGAGQTVWQWLPTNPIGPGDSPYQSVSAFAGSPLMVALEPLLAKGWLDGVTLPEGGWDPRRVDFSRIQGWRLAHLRRAHQGFLARATADDHQALAAWQAGQGDWLPDYLLFMAAEHAHPGLCWWQWPAGLRDREPSALAELAREQAPEMAFWAFVQWQFDQQCAAVRAYANAKGVAIMGDLPIFVAHHSADCWARPDLYFLDEQGHTTVVAGCPPDAMAVTGQRWGNPLYRWDRMAAEGFAWWTARVRRALGQADVFRIDHFRGFAAYYEIPASSPDATQGRWVQGPGLPLFQAIEAALGQLPIVAEDLGFITPDVTALRLACGFPGMKILQFGFGGDPRNEYLPHEWERESVAYTGTHDNDTARGWWDGAREAERAHAGTYLAAGAHDIHWAMIRACLNSVANMAIAPFQDVLGLLASDRMNTPGTMGGNWAWRFEWSQVGAEPGRVLGLLTAASGRGGQASFLQPAQPE